MTSLILAMAGGWWWGGYCREKGYPLTSVILGAAALGIGASVVCKALGLP